MALRSLATGKKYKNVYTILEKVKKGEIKTHYNYDGGVDSGLFSKINFYKKEDLITPHMHYIDERKLGNIVDGYVTDQHNIHQTYNNFSRTKGYQNLPDSVGPDGKAVKPNFEQFQKTVKEVYNKFPKHIKNDIFKMFYNKMEKLKFEDRTDKNNTKFKFLEKANNPVGKIMTEQSNLKSSIFTRNIVEYFVNQLAMLQYTDPQEAQELQDALNGNNDGDMSDQMKKMMGNAASQRALDKAMNDAMDSCKALDDSVPQDIQEEMFENASKDINAGKNFTPDYLNEMAAELRKMSMSMKSLKEKIKNLMNKSKNYFSAKKETIQEDLFNSDNIAGLDDYVFLHPKLRKVMIEDIVIKDTKAIGKVNLYIDVSGSMSDSCGLNTEEGGRITKLDFSKSFAFKMEEMGMLEKVYLFNNGVKETKKDVFSILRISPNGGTDIDAVIRHIRKTDSNAIIITDAEDTCREHTDKAFFIGVNGARFDSFDSSTLKDYLQRDQIIIFDGNRIKKVDHRGKVIN
jgi:hypothetical protein